MDYTKKIFLMASKADCPFCSKMKPVFEEVVKEYSGLIGLSFGQYDVESDDWDLADKLGLEGVPGFALLSEDAQQCYAVNNDGLVDKEVLISMILTNLGKQ